MRLTETITHASFRQPAVNVSEINHHIERIYRRRGLANLLKMGHCAPSVMQTILDIGNRKEEWLVKLTAGLPGGIGNTGFECGGVTAPMVHLGLDHGLHASYDGLPIVFNAGHEYCQRFAKCNHGLLCKEILGERRLPLPCIKVVRHAPELYKETTCRDNTDGISGETRDAFRLLYSHLSDNGFHCAYAVLRRLDDDISITQKLLDGTSGFMGGTVFQGRTCSAFAAGVMAVGLKMGEIENSHLRVFRMLSTMIVGGNALADHMNKFNRIMSIGNRMSEWFTREFGSTLCRDITKCDFSSLGDVHRFIEKGSLANCKTIAEKVAGKVETIIEQEEIGS